MKTIYLLRHAKSSWDDSSLPDHDRPLNGRGRSAAPRVGAHMRAEGYLPDLVLCSTATRTRLTLEGVLSELEVEPAIEFEEELYLAAPSEMLDLVRSVPDTVESVLLVGHNPGTGMLAATAQTFYQPGQFPIDKTFARSRPDRSEIFFCGSCHVSTTWVSGYYRVP